MCMRKPFIYDHYLLKRHQWHICSIPDSESRKSTLLTCGAEHIVYVAIDDVPLALEKDHSMEHRMEIAIEKALHMPALQTLRFLCSSRHFSPATKEEWVHLHISACRNYNQNLTLILWSNHRLVEF